MNTSEYAHPICRTRPRRFCKLRFHRFKRGLRVMDLAGSLKSATLSDSIKHCRLHNVLNAFWGRTALTIDRQHSLVGLRDVKCAPKRQVHTAKQRRPLSTAMRGTVPLIVVFSAPPLCCIARSSQLLIPSCNPIAEGSGGSLATQAFACTRPLLAMC